MEHSCFEQILTNVNLMEFIAARGHKSTERMVVMADVTSLLVKFEAHVGPGSEGCLPIF